MKKDILKSLLFAFLGLGITTLTFAGASTAITVPDKPGFPLAINIWETGCQIKYRAPKNDGGKRSKAATYRSAYTGKFHHCDLCFDHPFNEWDYMRIEMKENTNAQFRVSASNSAGISNPSGISDFITFRGRF